MTLPYVKMTKKLTHCPFKLFWVIIYLFISHSGGHLFIHLTVSSVHRALVSWSPTCQLLAPFADWVEEFCFKRLRDGWVLYCKQDCLLSGPGNMRQNEGRVGIQCKIWKIGKKDCWTIFLWTRDTCCNNELKATADLLWDCVRTGPFHSQAWTKERARVPYHPSCITHY